MERKNILNAGLAKIHANKHNRIKKPVIKASYAVVGKIIKTPIHENNTRTNNS